MSLELRMATSSSTFSKQKLVAVEQFTKNLATRKAGVEVFSRIDMPFDQPNVKSQLLLLIMK